MASEAALLLDQLMGATRNAVPGDDVKELKWSDDEVCKNYICGFCPSELFVNTKAEATVGSCYKVHDNRLKKAYEESTERGECGYEDLFLSHLERLVRDLDRKVERGKDRLRRSAQAKQESLHGDGPGGCSSDTLKKLNHEIEVLVQQLQHLGELGRVEETHELMMKLEHLEKARESERMAVSNSAPKVLAGFELDSNDFHEKMELCDVCGSFLVIGDTQSRVDAHLLGKQHIGFARIRTAIADLKLKKEERFRTKQKELAERRQQDQSSTRGHQRHSNRGHSRERRRSHRSYSRERSHRGLSPRKKSDVRRRYSGRSRSRDRRGSRSRSRDRRRSHSRSRDRRRSHSRSRDKRQSRSRRSRSRSRDRRSRSRSKDRRQSRSQSKDDKRPHSTSKEKQSCDSQTRLNVKKGSDSESGDTKCLSSKESAGKRNGVETGPETV